MLFGLAMLSFFGPKAPALGVSDGQLSECPGSPNCVCSMTDAEDFAIAPITFARDSDFLPDALEKIKQVIAAEFPRALLTKEKEDYLRYEFRTLVFRFVDDVEFLVVPDEQRIHFRSASRVGQSDLGLNRKRMEKIRKLLAE